MSDDPMAAIRRFGERLAEAVAGLGAQMQSFQITPSFSSGHPDVVMAAFVLDEDALKAGDEPVDPDRARDDAVVAEMERRWAEDRTREEFSAVESAAAARRERDRETVQEAVRELERLRQRQEEVRRRAEEGPDDGGALV